MSDTNNKETYLVPAAIGIAVLLLLGLVFRPIFFIVLIIAVVLTFFLTSYWIITNFRSASQEKKRENGVDGIIDRQLKLCGAELKKNRGEIREINQNIKELESSLDRSDELILENRKGRKRILAGFYRELELRKSKIEFYDVCKGKLDTLLYNHQFSKKLEEKQNRLNELREEHHEDLAIMESLRTELEYNKHYLETIEVLSLKMLESNTLDTAQSLHEELKEITRELRRL